jgi:polar amino acid transport system substrate-binding protein
VVFAEAPEEVSQAYFPGIFEAVYWALSTLTTQAEAMPRQWVGRALSIFWMFVGVVFVAFYTAQLTTALTVEQIRGGVDGPGDLLGKQVATLAGSNAVEYLTVHHAQVQEFPTTDRMFEALPNKKVDAVVSAAPLLLYFVAHEGKGRVKVVGPQFTTAPLAIMLQLDSSLHRKVDGALVTLRENGTYQKLYDNWFRSP